MTSRNFIFAVQIDCGVCKLPKILRNKNKLYEVQSSNSAGRIPKCMLFWLLVTTVRPVMRAKYAGLLSIDLVFSSFVKLVLSECFKVCHRSS